VRRIVTAVATTVTAIVLLFSYHTSTNGTAVTRTVTAGSARPAVHTASTAATFTGDVAQTRWGPVQVSVTVASRRITKAEAVQAQSAKIDTVSGASVTSNGYRQSLQSAIDQAHL